MRSKNLTQKTLNKSHASPYTSFEEAVSHLKKEILNRGDLPHVSVQEQLQIIEELTEFPLGRFILEMRGANGYWTDYMITYPETHRKTGLDTVGKPLSKWENFLVNGSPVVIASQERYKIFQRALQSLIKERVVLVSIPCGVMNDLLSLDYSKIKYFKLIGIDLDQDSLNLAKENAKNKHIDSVEFRAQNAWELADQEAFDVITSNGLNVYEADRNKIVDLYRRFFKALKPGGALIIGVLTYPPSEGKNTDWDLTGISQENLLMEQTLHKDVLGIKWRNFRSADELNKEFKLAGFAKVDILFDRHRIFPTIITHKSP